MRTATATLVALALGAVSQPALSEPKEMLTVHVSYADLDLSKAAGRETLDRRIRNAVDRVCPLPDIREVRRQDVRAACRQKVMASVEPQLARIYSGSGLAQANLNLASPNR